MHLQSQFRQTVPLGPLGSSIALTAGERIHTENSYKYRVDMIDKMLTAAGFSLDQTWFDEQKWFALNLARVG